MRSWLPSHWCKKQERIPLPWPLKAPSQSEDQSSLHKQQAEGGTCLVLCPFCFQHPPHPLMQRDRELWISLGQLSRTQGTYPILSTRSHNTLGVGTSGEPSYRTKDAPVARADTIQFHIIQPTCHKQGDQVSQAEVQAENPSTEGSWREAEGLQIWGQP